MESLYESLGQFYFAEHSNSPPSFVQVVGWTIGAERPTAKRRYVYIRKVPIKINHMIKGGGSWEYDQDIIKEYAKEVKTPVRKSIPKKVDGNAIFVDKHFIRYQSLTLRRITFAYAPIPLYKPPPPVITEIDPSSPRTEEIVPVSSQHEEASDDSVSEPLLKSRRFYKKRIIESDSE